MKNSSVNRQTNQSAAFHLQLSRLALAVAAIFLALSSLGLTAKAQTALGGSATQQKATPPEWQAVEKAIGKSGSLQPGDVFKIGMPRNDLEVRRGACTSIQRWRWDHGWLSRRQET